MSETPKQEASKSQKPKAAASRTSTSSQSSNQSQGIGDGQLPTAKAELLPNLTPEGLSLDPNMKLYDSIIYFIYCAEHDKIAVTNVQRARCVFLPFVPLPDGVTWLAASHEGVTTIIGNKDAELDAAVAARRAPNYQMTQLNVLRIQLSSEKFITRLANFVLLKKSSDSSFKCCQRSPRINWLRAADIQANRIDKIWGAELLNFTKQLIGKVEHDEIISEFTTENSLHYYNLDGSPEQRMLKASGVKPEHIIEAYEDFVEHCYPSFYMSLESFRHYMGKFGFSKTDPNLGFYFNAFSIYNHNYLDFHEVLLGIIAMEPATSNTLETRLKFIFRYYDCSRSQMLTLDEFVSMVQDMYTDYGKKAMTEDELRLKVEEAIKCVGINKNQKITLMNFIKAVLQNSFKNTEQLCRSPKPVMPQISRLMQIKFEDKTKSVHEGFLKSHRKTKGACPKCAVQNYDYCLHCVTFDTMGRCVDARIINERKTAFSNFHD